VSHPTSTTPTNAPGHLESPTRIFQRFLRFGCLAWGGPVAQIAMIREELVEQERWISREHFNRVLAVYQVLPGPEAHELCVYFGMRSGGRLGGLLAGLGFMLPGFVLMFALSWAYVRHGANAGWIVVAFYGCKPAVLALIVRAIHRIGSHAVTNRWLLLIAIGTAVASVAGVHFLIVLPAAGVLYALVRRGPSPGGALALVPIPLVLQPSAIEASPSLLAMLGYGLRGGLLTFGGAYTAIPFLQHDAVVRGGWMTNAQFLDGLALGGILPAPLIIFSTFVGYLGAGPLGGLAMTVGIFLPAFAFTLVAHEQVERLIANQAAHAFLDGVTAGVVGLIVVTAIGMSRDAVVDPATAVIFVGALVLAWRWKARAAVVGIVAASAVAGWLFTLVSS
jgi:chromate transporter